jgi:hypothetical protein
VRVVNHVIMGQQLNTLDKLSSCRKPLSQPLTAKLFVWKSRLYQLNRT